MPVWVKTTLAALVDLGVVASVLTGILAVIRRLTGTGVTASWADGLVVLAALAALYLFVTRRGTGATLGEALLHTTYLPRRVPATIDPGVTSVEIVDPQLESTAHLLHAAAPVPRLAVLRTLLKRPSTSGEVARALRMAPNESSYHLAALGQAGLVVAESGPEDGQRFHVADQSRGWISDLLDSGVAAEAKAAADTESAAPPTSPGDAAASS
jgi:DNA-binding transcriptional ArsR family regulator